MSESVMTASEALALVLSYPKVPEHIGSQLYQQAVAALRADAWVSVATDGLPKLEGQKPLSLAWLVWDGREIHLTHLHPSWWRESFNFPPTHWRPLPPAPEVKA